MPNPIAERRIALWGALGPQPLRLDRDGLRFSLGVSAADIKVPFHIMPEARQIVLRSARQLELMLISRHRDAIPKDDFDGFLLDEDFSRMPEFEQRLTPRGGSPDVKATADLAWHAHPALTGAVLQAWLGPGGGGRSLVALTLELLRRGQAERQLLRAKEDTPTLVLLMLTTLVPEIDAALRAVSISGPMERSLRGAAGAGVYLALQLAVQLGLRQSKAGPEALARADAILCPGALLGSRAQAPTSGATVFGCDLSAGLPGLDDAVAKLLSGAKPATVREALGKALLDSPEAAARAEAAVAEQELRGRLLSVIAHGEAGSMGDELLVFLRDLATKPRRLTEWWVDSKVRKQFAKDLLDESERLPNPAARNALGVLAAAIKAFTEKEPAAAVGLSRDAARGRYADAGYAFACDLALDRALMIPRRALSAPTGDESEGGLKAEYEAGRLYRLSEQPEPILKQIERQATGHLFVDVKDFTRRTSLLGQAAMADFLRNQFYVPILASAKAYHRGMMHLADRGGISLNNLLGDAVSISGDIGTLVGLARDIRRHLTLYEQQLKRSISGEQVAATLRSIEQEFARRAKAAGVDSQKLAAEREAALSRARGEGLEAGVFISYGPPPLVITLEDEAFGRSKVAIADRINESARGTARSPGARARADALLQTERDRRGNPHLVHPWSVFVGAPLSVSVSYAAEQEARAAFTRRDAEAAVKALVPAILKTLADTAAPDGAMGDIYNAGAALSEEGLKAFRDASADERTFREITFAPDALHASIRERYFFPPELLHFVVAFDQSERMAELFRFAGRALFKGFERQGGIAIWELLSESGFAELIGRHHASSWRTAPAS